MSTPNEKIEFIAVGRRKTATARVRITEGTGEFTINGRKLEAYCCHDQLEKMAIAPLVVAEKKGQFDVKVNVRGGGLNGQSAAIAHGLARALQKFDPELRGPLKKAGLIRRDPRMKERKKAGQPGARKRFQFSKR